MKEIGIVTFHRSFNYGAALQAYALSTFLTKQKYPVKIIDYRCSSIENPYRNFHIDNTNPHTALKTFLSNIYFFRQNNLRKKHFVNFIKNHLSLTPSYTQKEIIEQQACNNFNILVTGSDQIWNENLTNDLDQIYALEFGDKNAIKIAYAASTGRDSINSNTNFKTMLSNLDYISVREENLINIFQPLTKKPIHIVCDPVFLLSQNEWGKVIKTNHSPKEPYIFCYDIHSRPDLYNLANYVSEKEHLKIIHFSRHNRGYHQTISKSHYTDGPLEFLTLLYNASYVFTDSFHGTALSIIFQKNFWSFARNNGSNSRITNLLHQLNLENRLIQLNTSNNYKSIYNQPIDYNSQTFNQKINRYITDSKTWLLNAVKRTS